MVFSSHRLAVGALLAGLIVCSGAGCTKEMLPPADDQAARQAVNAFYAAKKDSRRQVRIKQVMPTPDGARVVVKIKYPDFHTVATERTLVLTKPGGQWKVDKVVGGS